MNEDLRKTIFCLFCVIILIVGGLFFVIHIENKNQEKIAPEGQLQEDTPWEWISPDGVHYWVIDYGIGNCKTRMMAPRYTREGQLVIEEK